PGPGRSQEGEEIAVPAPVVEDTEAPVRGLGEGDQLVGPAGREGGRLVHDRPAPRPPGGRRRAGRGNGLSPTAWRPARRAAAASWWCTALGAVTTTSSTAGSSSSSPAVATTATPGRSRRTPSARLVPTACSRSP